MTPVALVAKLREHLRNAVGRAYQLPPFGDGGGAERYLKNPHVVRWLEELEALHYYIIGIGQIADRGPTGGMTHAFNSLLRGLNRDVGEALRERSAVCEILYQPISASGATIDDRRLADLHDRVLGLPLTALSKIVRKHGQKSPHEIVAEGSGLVIAVAGGAGKVEGILAASRARLFDVLITDSATATAILERDTIPKRAAGHTKAAPRARKARK